MDREPPPNGYAAPPRTKILLAVTPEMRVRMARILARHELMFVDTSDQAMQALEERHGIVVVAVHFDDSRMFSLLGDIRAHSGYRKVPILCVLGSRGRAITDIASYPPLAVGVVPSMGSTAMLYCGSSRPAWPPTTSPLYSP